MDFEKTITAAALDRLLKYARALAYADDDPERRRRGLFLSMQLVATQLDGLADAVRGYDKTLELLAERSRADDPQKSEV